MPKSKTLNYHKYYLLVFILLIGLFLIILKSKDQSPTVKDDKTKQKQYVNETTPANSFEPITISGTGNKLTDPIKLDAGGYKVSTNYIPSSSLTSFIGIVLVDKQGNSEAFIASETEDKDISTSINVPYGEYRFNVETNGQWTIRVEKL